MNNLKRIATTAGLSVLLSTGALAQDANQEVNLADIEVDSITITDAGGRQVFNQVSADDEAPTIRGGTRIKTGRGGAQAGATSEGTATRNSGTRVTRGEKLRGGTPASGAASATGQFDDMEGCVELSNTFVTNAVRRAEAGTNDRGRLLVADPNADEFTDFTAKCYNDGKEVGTITFGEDGTPTIELSGMDGP